MAVASDASNGEKIGPVTSEAAKRAAAAQSEISVCEDAVHTPKDLKKGVSQSKSVKFTSAPSIIKIASNTAAAPSGASKSALPKPANPVAPKVSEQAKAALNDFQGATKDVVSGLSKTTQALRKGYVINVNLENITSTLFISYVLFQLVLFKWLQPGMLHVLLFTVIGVAVGLAFSYQFYVNQKEKEQIRQVLGTNIGLKGLQTLLGNLPSWLSYTEREKMEWFNGLLETTWPYVDRGVCKMVKEQTEALFADMLKQMTVPGLKGITLKHITFGDAPFRFESMKVKEEYSEYVEMEVGIRWCGDANITMAIELGGVVDNTKICPRVTDISFVGVARIRLQPLVDIIPGFGAISVTFAKPPVYKYRMDFGAALGGQTMANIVQPFINSVATEVIQNMMVWPQRLVIPLVWNNPKIALEVERMAYRSQGLMKVTVNRATKLKSTDIGGRSDPLVEMTTDGRYIAETEMIPKTLEPEWNETFWLVVHEPASQEMKVWVSDKDMFSPSDLIKLKMSNVVGSKELVGRCMVSLAPITSQEPEAVESWYHLGDGDWSRPEGCGKGMGRIQLTCLYRSLGSFKSEEVQTADKGILSYRMIKITKLGRTMTITAILKVNDEKFVCGPVTNYQGGEHVFYFGNTKDFYGVPYDAEISLQVFQRSLVGDDLIGVIELPLTDVAMSVDYNVLEERNDAGFFDRAVKLEEADGGVVHMQLRYMPYF